MIKIGVEHIPVRPPRREPASAYHIERQANGFQVTNAEEFPAGTFFQWGSPETLEKVLNEVILPRVCANVEITADELMSEAEGDRDTLQRLGLRDVPWTGLYLLTQWHLAQASERGEDQPPDPAFGRAAELLEQVYQPLRVMHQVLADPGPFRSR